jgi:hypothetical protein
MSLRTLWVFQFCALALLSSPSEAGEPGKNPAFEPTAPVHVGLANHFDSSQDSVNLAFGENKPVLCAWWWPHRRNGDYTKEPVEFVVLNMDGKLVGSSDDSNRVEWLREFPVIAWREISRTLLTDAVGWGFSPDLSKGFRISRLGQAYSAEMWDLRQPARNLWSTQLPTSGATPWSVSLFQALDKGPVLVAISTKSFVLLERDKGQIERTVDVSSLKPRADATTKKKELPIGRGRDFSGFETAYEPTRGLVAWGAFYGQTVRVLQLSEPEHILFEANTGSDLSSARGGTWNVQRLAFLGAGKFLLAEYHFGGRGTRLVLEPTDVFETASWKRVWRENEVDIRAVTVSPDGRTMAFLRRNVLELRPFLP